MTREDAISIMNVIVHMLEPQYDTDRIEDAVEIAIKALEQESIFDKIRAEINRQEKWLLQAGYTAYNVDIAFDAIKSVVAESEEV